MDAAFLLAVGSFLLTVSARNVKKVPTKSKKESQKSAKERLFQDSFDIFGTFSKLGADRPGKTFSILFRDPDRKAPPVTGSSNRHNMITLQKCCFSN